MEKSAFTYRKIIFSAAQSLLLILNMFLWKNMIFGIVFTIVLLSNSGYALGKIFLSKFEPLWQKIFGVYILLAILSIAGTGIYYFYRFDLRVVAILCSSFALAPLPFVRAQTQKKEQAPVRGSLPSGFSIIMFIAFCIFEIIAFALILSSRTPDAIRSPWQSIPREFFFIYAMSTFSLIGIIIYGKHTRLSLACTAIHSLLSVSCAAIVYKLGYGFDPIIHQATESVIADLGEIHPKPFYYIGQYVMVVFLHHLTRIPLPVIDTALVPVLAGIGMPLAAYTTLGSVFQKNRNLGLAALLVLIIPFSSYIVTTPQSLANLYTLLVIFFSIMILGGNTYSILPLLAIFALAALAIHPLSGIIACFIVFFIFAALIIRCPGKIFSVLRKFLLLELGLLMSLALPIVFLLNNSISASLASGISWESLRDKAILTDVFGFLLPIPLNNFSLTYDMAYFYESFIPIAVLLLSLTGGFLAIRKHGIKSAWIYFALFGIIFANYAFLRFVFHFPSLIDYEQANYPNRVREIAWTALLPMALYGCMFLIVRLEKRSSLLTAFFIFFTASVLTSSMYLSYPRVDAFHLDRGYNLTMTDINAVRYIDETAQGNYLVLANQITSAAAIREFGFKKYFQDPEDENRLHFYYPLPTGDPLYQYYLQMVYDGPKKEIAKKAQKRFGISTIYLILNKYWDRYDALVEQGKQEADAWQSIDQGQAYIFLYDLKSSP